MLHTHVASKTKTWMRWMMLMLMKCKCKYVSQTPEVLQLCWRLNRSPHRLGARSLNVVSSRLLGRPTPRECPHSDLLPPECDMQDTSPEEPHWERDTQDTPTMSLGTQNPTRPGGTQAGCAAAMGCPSRPDHSRASPLSIHHPWAPIKNKEK
jgi:hypothetical protein